jgi:hypothetical protein
MQGTVAAGVAMLFGGGLLRDSAEIFEEDEENFDDEEQIREDEIDEAPIDQADAVLEIEGEPKPVPTPADEPADKSSEADEPVESSEEVEDAEPESEDAAPGPMAVPFGPFIALAALEHFFIGELLPSMFSMSYLYQFGYW